MSGTLCRPSDNHKTGSGFLCSGSLGVKAARRDVSVGSGACEPKYASVKRWSLVSVKAEADGSERTGSVAVDGCAPDFYFPDLCFLLDMYRKEW